MRDDAFRSAAHLSLLQNLLDETVTVLQKTSLIKLQPPTSYDSRDLPEGGFGKVAVNFRGHAVKQSKLDNLITWVNAVRELHVLARMPTFDTYFPVFIAAKYEKPYLYLEFEKANCDAFDYVGKLPQEYKANAIELLDMHIGNALHFMHWNETYHCDVKLENVLVFGEVDSTLEIPTWAIKK